jgi:tetratricopeptide (TPR) repeat protein
MNLALVSCASLPGQWRQPDEHLPPYREIETVPFLPQKIFQCGPSSLAMVLAWSGTPVDPDTLSAEVFTPSQKGSLQPAMISAARRHGRIAYPIAGAHDLLQEVAAGHPAIVLQNRGLSWFPVWHYAVVIGYDLDEGFVILHSGDSRRKLLRLRVFDHTWARSDYWALLVLAPNDLPVTAQEDEFVAAVVGLEKAGQWAAAVEAYSGALRRWPNSFSALMGLGNSYYALGDMTAAEKTFRSATHRFPNEGAPFNNMAQALWEQGKKEEALIAAQKAVAAGGPLTPIYEQTLRQIQKQP